jgi:hypothetical protein
MHFKVKDTLKNNYNHILKHPSMTTYNVSLNWIQFNNHLYF